MATFERRADLFGQRLLLEAEGQIRSAFADHPEWVPDSTLQERMVQGIGKRVAAQFFTQWERLSWVRSAVAKAATRAHDNTDGVASTNVIPSRRLKRKLLSASTKPRRQVRGAFSKRQFGCASVSPTGPVPTFSRREADALYRRITIELGRLAGQSRRDAESGETPAERVRATIRHAAVVDALRLLATLR